MKRCLASCFVVVALVGGGPVSAQSKAKAENVPEIAYDAVPNFFKLPADVYFGEGIGIATNSKGHVFVYTRSGHTKLLEFDQNGNYVREIGQGNYGFEFAHTVRVDAQDNIWAVDEGTNMIIKFNPEGRVVMVLGRRPEAVEGAVATATPAKDRASATALRTRPKRGAVPQSAAGKCALRHLRPIDGAPRKTRR